MLPLSRLVLLVSLGSFAPLLGASSAAAGTSLPVTVDLLPGAPEIDPAALREAVARELDVPVIDGESERSADRSTPGGAQVTRAAFGIVVSIDRARSELVVERRDSVGGMSRRVPLPADPRQTLRIAIYLIGNLARDEAGDVVRQLRPAPPAGPSPEPSDEASPEPQPTPAPKASAPRSWPRVWLGVDFAYDLVGLQSASRVCTAGSGYACVDSSGNDVTASDSTSTMSDRVAGGLTPGNFRGLVTFDYAVTENVLVGVRLGTVQGTYPGRAASAFPPFHVEARATYVLGDAPLARRGVAPYAMVAAGASQWSAGVGVAVIQPAANGQAPLVLNPKAWEIAGPGFASIGAGVRWAMTPELALVFGPRFNVAFGNNSPLFSISPELGLAYGL